MNTGDEQAWVTVRMDRGRTHNLSGSTLVSVRNESVRLVDLAVGTTMQLGSLQGTVLKNPFLALSIPTVVGH